MPSQHAERRRLHPQPAARSRSVSRGALAALDYPVEVIVVDSASEPSCRELVEGYAVADREPDLSARGTARAFSGSKPRCGRGGRRAHRLPRRRCRASPRLGPTYRGSLRSDPAIGCVGGACNPSSATRRGPHGCPIGCSSSLRSRASARSGARPGRVRSGRSARTWPSGGRRSVEAGAFPGGARA